MAETLIIILAEHNVPINFADHFTKLVSTKLVFPDSVFLRACSAGTLLAKSSHRAHCHYFFSRNLTCLHIKRFFFHETFNISQTETYFF